MNEDRRTILFLALVAITPPVATDMYLAAIPRIAEQWNQPVPLVNLSLILWFASFSFFLLIMGPISDKIGRKPVLVGGLAAFIASSLLCALSQNAYQLIAFRILQGLGSAAPSAMVMAISRDRFDGTKRKVILAYIGVIIAVAPMLAPMIGSMLLAVGSWRLIFLTQASLAFFSFILATRFSESIAEKSATRFVAIFTRYGVLLKNRKFVVSMLAMTLIISPFYGFIGFSPVLYIRIFGLSEFQFSLLFGMNAIAAMAGSFASARLAARYSSTSILSTSFAVCVGTGAALIVTGGVHPMGFAIPMLVFAFFTGTTRPVSTNLVLEQVQTDIGSASSLIMFTQFLLGAGFMAVSTLNWEAPAFMFGLLTLTASSAVFFVWPVLRGRLLRAGTMPA